MKTMLKKEKGKKRAFSGITISVPMMYHNFQSLVIMNNEQNVITPGKEGIYTSGIWIIWMSYKG